jgi:hypothetical protein
VASKRKKPTRKPSKPKKRTKTQAKRSQASKRGWETRRANELEAQKKALRKSQASRKGWETRRARKAVYAESVKAIKAPIVQLEEGTVERTPLGFTPTAQDLAKGQSALARYLSRYGKTQDKAYYDQFRELKRDVYNVYSAAFAREFLIEAGLEAGWDLDHAEIFSVLS